MAIYRSLRTLISKKSNQSRAFVTATSTPSFSVPCPYGPLSSNPLFHSNSNRFLSPLSKWITPFQGPLFLSRTPWKLSQQSTPLFLRRGIVLRKVQALNLNLRLLQSRQRKTIELASAVSFSGNPLLLDRVDLNGQTQNLLESFVNWPNFISMSRMISGPFLGWMIVNEWYAAALVGLAVSGATDWLDGYVARKMNINSVVGSYLDPLADKVLIGCVALAMVHNDLLPLELVGIVVLRDVGLVGGAVYKRASDLGWQWQRWSDFFNLDGTRPVKVEPLFISKVNTVLQLVLVAAALLQPEFGTLETQSYITYLSWLVASTTIGSTAAYGVQFMKRRSITMRP